MKRRQSECFRNLDDPLKIFSLLTFKSCGLVLLFYAGAVATELLLGLWSLLFAEWSFLAQLVAAGLLVALLSYTERHDDVVWSRTGHLTLVYRVQAFHEPGLDGADFDAAALLAENSWAGLPEGTCYQFYVFVDQRRGVRRLEEVLPPIGGDGPKERLLEEFRRARLHELTRIEENGAPSNLVQDRRHYLCATFRPVVPKSSALDGPLQGITALLTAWARGEPVPRLTGRWETTYEALVEEAARFARRVE